MKKDGENGKFVLFPRDQEIRNPLVAIVPVEFIGMRVPAFALKKHFELISGEVGENCIQVAAKHCPLLYRAHESRQLSSVGVVRFASSISSPCDEVKSMAHATRNSILGAGVV